MIKVSLRLITIDNLENLRQWKNDHREFFFFKGEITSEQQREWFDKYQERPNDYMFIVLADNIEIGCIGIRLIDGIWDLYNVILALTEYGGKGLMSRALMDIVHFANLQNFVSITSKVLKKNPAVSWYRKNGFVIISEKEDYYNMLYQGIYQGGYL